MNKTEKKIPKLRFPEFEGSLNLSEIGNRIDVITGYAFKGDDISEDSAGIPIMRGINITEGYIRHNKDIDRYFLGDISDLDKYILLSGDLVLGMDGSKVGKNVAVLTKDDEGSLLIQRVARIRSKNNSCLKFIYHNIFSYRFHRYVDIVNTSSGIPHISIKQIREFKINFPSLPEQQKIASFLTAVDQKIELLACKKELLEQYKKGVMQKLFPSTGSGNAPEIRFKIKNEAGELVEPPDWEEKRLEKIGDIVGGGTPDTNTEEYWGGTIPWFTPTEINTKFIKNSERTITELGLKKSSAKILPIGTILLTTRATIGEVAISEASCSTNQGFQSLIVKKNNNNLFVYYWLKMNTNELIRRANGSTFKEISKSEIEKVRIEIPSIEEQAKIANFLSAIDDKINKVAEALEATRTFKKGLLQQLFV